MFASPPSKAIAAKILRVQTAISGLPPLGVMTINGRQAKYITKHQVVAAVKHPMGTEGLAAVFGGIVAVQTLMKRTIWRNTTPRTEAIETKERYWIVYHLIDVENDGEPYTQVIPADVTGTDSKNATVAMAYAERDFLANTFLVHSTESMTEEDERMSDYTPQALAKNVTLDDTVNMMRIKVVKGIEKVSNAKFGAELKRKGLVLSSLNPDDMTPEELMQAFLVIADIINPDKAKSHLGDVVKKAQGAETGHEG
jgi:hypothetical protein